MEPKSVKYLSRFSSCTTHMRVNAILFRMSKIDTIESISNKLAETTITVVPKRCSYIRNWHSTCRYCLSVCQHDAIERSLGRLKINSEKCTGCGACVAACPTSAMLTSAPNQNEIVRQAKESARRNAGSAAFICEKQALEQHVDTERVVVLPCLNYLDEYLISGLFALKFKRVVLFSCGCDDCEMDCSEPYLDQMIQSTHHLLEQWNVSGTFATLDAVVPALVLADSKKRRTSIQSDRREAFKQGGASALEFAWQSVSDAIGSFTGEEPRKDGDKQIIVRAEERFDAKSYRSVRMLAMLDHIGIRPRGATVESRMWASVNIDPNRCRYCGACALMCVTQALKYEKNADGLATLTFQPSLCINCRLCKDSCLTHSMIYTNKIPANDLDGEVLIDLYRDHELPKSSAGFIQ